jgi:hypothetical protein
VPRSDDEVEKTSYRKAHFELRIMKKPTREQLNKWGLVLGLGCMACRKDGKFTFGEIHHSRHEYGNRNHDLIFSLCPVHHRPTSGITGIPNRHGNPKEFSAKYGTDKELFEKCMELIKGGL